ncbi:hypothetical protein JIG36_04695 [Actinoplanes sp. LDG1-06]|uniref:DUF4352 domain-containing protein n=1 Tax=Paractinoplanes ovalisporus TaxID=2810368 RepID=A0ABS2A555_9ACTN|nr:hypothetical protein [Actinoplanes ovalisporus]MBM2614855.1 hypothetical protein [Actinoplanes ovalisporus]
MTRGERTPVTPGEPQQGEPSKAAPRRRPMVLVAGVVAAAAGITAVATYIHRAPEAEPYESDPAAVAEFEARLWESSPWLYATPVPPAAIDPATTAGAPTVNPRPTSPPPAVPAGGGVLPSDGAVVLPGDSGEEMTLRVIRIANPVGPFDPRNPHAPYLPPRLGYRHIEVVVEIRNTGAVPFLSDVEKYSRIVGKDGRSYPHDPELSATRQLQNPARLDPGSWTEREIVFELKGEVDPARFRLSTHPGEAGQTQEWQLT